MKVYNPTEEAITITYKGVDYTAPAGGFAEEVPATVAEHWKTMIHNFVIISDDSASVAPSKPEVKAAVVQIPVEEVVAQEVASELKKTKK